MLLGICKHIILCIHIACLAFISLISQSLAKRGVAQLHEELEGEIWPYGNNTP